MSLVALPASLRRAAPSLDRRLVWLIPVAVALVLMGLYWVLFARAGASGAAADANSGRWFRIVPADLDVKVKASGDIGAVNNIDILCQVEGQSLVTTLVKEGTVVKKGDVLITLDSSAIRQKIEDTTLDLQKAVADLTTAKELREIQVSQNSANIAANEVSVQLADIDLKQYEEGTYPQMVKSATADLDMANITFKNTQEDLAQTRALYAKGFVTAADVKKSELAVTTAQAAVDKADTALKVLTQYTHAMDTASKRSAKSQADQTLVRTRRENASNLAQKESDVNAKSAAYEVLKRRMEKWQVQLAACTILAPADGLVVYATSQDRNAQAALQEGAQVRQQQMLFRLPDNSSMKAQIRINESVVWKLHEGMRAKVMIAGVAEPIGATLSKISVLVDNSQRWWNPDLREYPVDLTLDATPAGMKPGLGCQAVIEIDHRAQVPAVPLTSIYSMGNDSYVFVASGKEASASLGGATPVQLVSGEWATPVKVKLGQTNETQAEMLEGVGINQDVLILQAGQGQALLDKAGIKPPPAPASDDPNAAPGDKPRKRRGGAGGGAAAPAAPVAPGAASPETPAAPGGAAPAAAPATPAPASAVPSTNPAS